MFTKTNNKYLNGAVLYGDDFSYEEIRKWYEEEAEGYFNLISNNSNIESNYLDLEISHYPYHTLNRNNGFSFLPENKVFQKVLGLGSSYGCEFRPIASKIKELIILEPSENLKSEFITESLRPRYLKPEISGNIDFPSETFDLVTCFGTLHHIPNVNFVLSELIRVTAPGGYLLIREPIRSMGDWTNPRPGLTKNERGIPLGYFRDLFKSYKDIHVISEKFCWSLFLMKFLNKLGLKTESKLYGHLDQTVSNLLKWNQHYHPKTILQKLGPGSVFYVLKKI